MRAAHTPELQAFLQSTAQELLADDPRFATVEGTAAAVDLFRESAAGALNTVPDSSEDGFHMCRFFIAMYDAANLALGILLRRQFADAAVVVKA